MPHLLFVSWLLTQAASAEEPAQEPAQEPTPPPEDPKEAEIAALKERLRALEAQMDALGDQTGAPDAVPLDLETHVHGYASVDLQGGADRPLGFGLGEVVFSYEANLDRRMRFLSEVEFESADLNFESRIERLEIAFAPTRWLGVRAGWLPAPWSYWARQGLDGSFRFLPTSAPAALAESEDDEVAPMPDRQLGAWLEAELPLGLWLIQPTLGLSNGRASLPEMLSTQEQNLGKAASGRLWFLSPGGVVFGPSFAYDFVETDGSVGAWPADFDELIGGFVLGFPGANLDVRAEAFAVVHDLDGVRFVSPMGYAIVGLPRGRTTPYLRGELVAYNQEDPVYLTLGAPAPIARAGGGLRYELGLHLACKVEVLWHGSDAGPLEQSGATPRSAEEAGVDVHLQLAAGF